MPQRALSPWQERARAAGLQQKQLAEITGKTEINVSQQLRGMYGGKGEPPRYVVAIILAWELMTLEQRAEWLAQLGTKGSLPTEKLLRSTTVDRLRNALRIRREKLQLSREHIAVAVGSTWRHVQDFEQGADVALSFAAKYADAVGLTFDLKGTAEEVGIAHTFSADTSDDDLYEVTDSLPEDVVGA